MANKQTGITIYRKGGPMNSRALTEAELIERRINSDPIRCGECYSTNLEREIDDEFGMLADVSWVCHDCGWAFIPVDN